MKKLKLAVTSITILLITCFAVATGLADGKSGYYQYKVNSDGTAVITKYTGAESALKIPETIEGHTIVEIGKRAFYSNDDLVSVELPASVHTIGSYAFAFCDDMQTLTMSATVIKDHAFTNCSALETVTILSEGTNVEDRAFYDCDSMETLTGVIINPDKYSFAFCDSLREITIGGEKVKDHAFTNCGDLETLTLLGDSMIIEERAFYDCERLKTINGVVADVESYAFAFDKDLQSVAVKGAKVGDHAFTNCSRLKTVKIITTGATIEDRAFYDCEKLETVDGILGDIGDYSFGFCGKLKTIKVVGTDIDSRAFASCSSLVVEIPNDPAVITALSNAKVHYVIGDFGSEQPEKTAESVSDLNDWKCANCGAMATGRFCSNCGAAKPESVADESAISPTRDLNTPAPTETPQPAQDRNVNNSASDFKDILNYVLSPISDATVVSIIDMGDDILSALMSNGKTYTILITDSDGSYIIECMDLSASSYDSIEDPYDYKDPLFTATLNYLMRNDNKTIVSIIPLYGSIYTAMDSDGKTYMITTPCSESMATIGLLGM